MTATDGDPSSATDCSCKVGRVAAARSLDELDEELADRRRGRTGDPASLRALAEHVNVAVVRAAMTAVGMNPLDGAAENTYRLLTDDAAAGGGRTRAERKLERAGVDVAAVRADFVSHPTVGKHLRECLDVERPAADDTVDAARQRIFRMQSRNEAVIEDALAELARDGEVAAGDLGVVVDAQVVCETCGSQQSVEAFLSGDGCDCEE